MNAVLSTTASLRLRAKLEPPLNEIAARSALIAAHDQVREIYPGLLMLLYSEVRASVPLMRAALQTTQQRVENDLVAAGMLDWLEAHIIEELHHDEWLLDDYAALGQDPADLLHLAGSPSIAAMVGSACSVYYWMLHAHPVAVLGYCAVLEGSPPSSTFVDELEARTGYPTRAFMTLRHHSATDVDHGGELFGLIDDLPLTSDHESLIRMTALQTADLAIEATDELLSRVS